MFHAINETIAARMQYLEDIDARDRTDNTPRLQRLRQIPPETGKFLAILAAGTPPGNIIEVGSSGGYSTLWLTLAAVHTGRMITTFEIMPEKIKLARETFTVARVADHIELIEGDARQHLSNIRDIAFCFLDAEKDVYADCYEMIIPNLIPGGLLVADNAINHQVVLQPMLDRALSDPRVDALIVPIGKGELVCRKIG